MTTVTLPDSLVQQVEEAISQDLDLLVESMLRQELARRRVRGVDTFDRLDRESRPSASRHAAERPVERPTEQPMRVAPVGASGVLPDIDLTRWAAFIASDEGHAEISRALND
jgi:antitoxin component of MazEF toxin-antitoxin module